MLSQLISQLRFKLSTFKSDMEVQGSHALTGREYMRREELGFNIRMWRHVDYVWIREVNNKYRVAMMAPPKFALAA